VVSFYTPHIDQERRVGDDIEPIEKSTMISSDIEREQATLSAYSRADIVIYWGRRQMK
jgi:hypothetical protein